MCDMNSKKNFPSGAPCPPPHVVLVLEGITQVQEEAWFCV